MGTESRAGSAETAPGRGKEGRERPVEATGAGRYVDTKMGMRGEGEGGAEGGQEKRRTVKRGRTGDRQGTGNGEGGAPGTGEGRDGQRERGRREEGKVPG